MATKKTSYPKPKRNAEGVAAIRKKRGRPTKMNPKGDPFVPVSNGNPDSAI